MLFGWRRTGQSFCEVMRSGVTKQVREFFEKEQLVRRLTVEIRKIIFKTMLDL